MTPTILITGVGSLVGAGILDALAGRRQGLRIVGTTFGVESPGAYRCDEAILTELSDGPGFADELAAIIDAVQPDLVIPGRDPDVTALAAIADRVGPARVMVGSAAAAETCADKLAFARFAAAHGLPTVPTALATDGPIPVPAIAKPRWGSGSLGVRVILDDAQMQRAVGEPGMLLQPFIGTAPRPPAVDAGWPLFWQLAEARLGGVQGVLGPDGGLLGAIAFETRHEVGKVTNQWPVEDFELAELGERYLRALGRAGWRGPTNVSAIHDGQRWLGIEINGRFTGGTAARTAMGFDEVGMAINAWLGAPVVPPLAGRAADTVVMQPVARCQHDDEMADLRGDGRWTGESGERHLRD